MNFVVYTEPFPKKKFVTDALAEYAKRVSRYGRIALKTGKIPPPKASQAALYLSREGRAVSSEELAQIVQRAGLASCSELVFLPEDMEGATAWETAVFSDKISISPMSVETGLMAVVVYEQIYRACRILANEPYHR